MKYNKLKLIELIQDNRKKLTDIPKKIGMSYSMIGRISRGESLPSVDSLPKFAEYFGKDINYFFDDVKVEKTLNTSEPQPEYQNPWQLLYEKQTEITELKIEIERLKNVSARRNGAQAG